jgi:prepilin-type N-terminal cleavage/methylation domain-containing protein
MSTSRQSSQNRIWPIRGAAGFTLIEMAIVIIIIGVIISIVSTVLPALIRTSKIKKAQAVLEKVDYALQGYISSNGQLPCPDTDNPQDGLENRIAGTTPPTDDTCTAYVGRLPYATLGLSSATDPWQNVVRYGVYEGLVRTTQTNLCAALPCSPCLADFVNNPTGAWLSTSDGTTVTNVGYVLASGSGKDLDGDGAFFDGRNATAPATAQFESPNKITDPAYDDILRTGDLTYLQGRLCTGGGGGGGGGSGGNVEVCDDVGVNDEDGDGLANCNDPDCAGHPACVGGTNVIIITPSFPSGTVNDTYATTVQASGGVTPYEWQITDNGGFSSLFLHTYTGQLSGSLNQCPGTYSVTVAVADTTTPTATTDSRGYTIDVASDLTVSRTSGPGTNIDWVSATQEETFQANGGHLGDITWSLTTGGADGFTVAANGSSSAIVKKSGETTTGVGPYTFVLTAEDGSCSGNSAQLIFTVTIPASGSGAAAPYTVGMEAQWRLDECTVWDGSSYDVEDYLGNPLHYGRRIGNVTGVTNGKICRAASFDGASARIVSDVLTGSDIMGFGDAVTLACWFKSPGGGGGYPRLIEFSDAAGRHTRSTAIAYDPDGSLRAWVTSEAGVRGGEIDYSATRYDDNVWHHAVYTYSAGNGGRLYVDGDLKQTGTDDPTSDIHDAETFVIGGYFPDATNGFLGLIDEVAVFQRELTAAEITQLFESTRGSCPGSCYTAPIAEYQMETRRGMESPERCMTAAPVAATAWPHSEAAAHCRPRPTPTAARSAAPANLRGSMAAMAAAWTWGTPPTATWTPIPGPGPSPHGYTGTGPPARISSTTRKTSTKPASAAAMSTTPGVPTGSGTAEPPSPSPPARGPMWPQPTKEPSRCSSRTDCRSTAEMKPAGPSAATAVNCSSAPVAAAPRTISSAAGSMKSGSTIGH